MDGIWKKEVDRLQGVSSIYSVMLVLFVFSSVSFLKNPLSLAMVWGIMESLYGLFAKNDSLSFPLFLSYLCVAKRTPVPMISKFFHIVLEEVMT